MNMFFKKTSVALAVLALSSVSFGQKKNETSAAVEFKNKFLPAMMGGDMETAKKVLISAKKFIDLAAEHEDTQDSPKTLWLKGEIYSNFLFVGMQTMDTAFVNLAGEDALDQSINAFSKGYNVSPKFKSDIENSVHQKITMINGFAGMLYNGGQFNEAAELYDIQSRFSDAINELDSVALNNSALCYEKADKFEMAAIRYERLAKVNYRGTTSAVLASSAYRKAGNIEKAKAIINEARKENPSDRELLLELVNTNIDAGDAAGAEAALADAIKTDPNNKQLHYTIGTIYIDLGENEKAETALNKALSIDANYADAQYQLGAHLVTWAGNLKTEANQLKFGDPNYNKMILDADEAYKRALIPLEAYIVTFPDEKAVLNILFQIHRNLGNSDKALEYKKRAEGME